MSAEAPRPGDRAAQRWAWNLQRSAAASRSAALAAGVAAAVLLGAAALLASRELARRLPGLPLPLVAVVLAGLAVAALATAALHLLFARTWDRLVADPGRPAAEDAAFALRAVWAWSGLGAVALALGLAAALALGPRGGEPAARPPAGVDAGSQVTLGLRPAAGGEPVWSVPDRLPAQARPAEGLPDRPVQDTALRDPPFGRFLMLEDVPRACALDGTFFCILNQGGSAVSGPGVQGPAGVAPVARRLSRKVRSEVLRPGPYNQPTRLALHSTQIGGVDDGWEIEIAPRDGQALEPGLYEGATSSSARRPSQPFFRLHTPGSSCDGGSARFRIHDIELDVDGRPRRLVLDFEGRCGGWVVGRVQLARG